MNFSVWAIAVSICAILISFLEIQQTECVTLLQLLAVWRTTTTTKPRSDLQLGTVHSSKLPANSVPTVDYGFKGVAHDRTESSLYPTTPSGDTEFQKWEEEEEKKYALEILAQLASPNDTKIEHKTKQLLANVLKSFLVNAAKDNATALDYTNTTTGASISPFDFDDEIQDPAPEDPQVLNLRQETDNEKTIAAFFKNRNPPVKTTPMFSNITKVSEALSMSNGQINPMQTFMRILGGIGGPMPSVSNTTHSSPLMKLIRLIRVPAMTPESGARFQEQVQKLRTNLNQRNISGVVDESLKIASPISINSLISGVVQLVRCNTLQRLDNDICN